MYHLSHALSVEIITKEAMMAENTNKKNKLTGEYINYTNATCLDLSRY